MQVIVDGLLTNYQQIGKGKPVLLLHGWGDSSKTYALLAKELAEKYEVLTLDLPGFGGTQAPPKAWGLEDYARFVQLWLAKIEAPKLYAIAGHSNGGAIGIVGLADAKFNADKLILLAAAGVRGEYNTARQLRKMVIKAGKAATAPLPKHLKRKIKSKVYQASGSEALLFPELEDSFRKIVAQDVRADASKLKQPTLIIYGTEDQATPVRYGRFYNSLIKNSQLEIIEGAGHFVHQEQPETVNKLIQDFLDA